MHRCKCYTPRAMGFFRKLFSGGYWDKIKSWVGSGSSRFARHGVTSAANRFFSPSAASLGADTADWFENAFPGTNPWEHLSSGQQGQAGQMSMAAATQAMEMQKTKETLQTQERIAKYKEDMQNFRALVPELGADTAAHLYDPERSLLIKGSGQSYRTSDHYMRQLDARTRHTVEQIANEVKRRGLMQSDLEWQQARNRLKDVLWEAEVPRSAIGKILQDTLYFGDRGKKFFESVPGFEQIGDGLKKMMRQGSGMMPEGGAHNFY